MALEIDINPEHWERFRALHYAGGSGVCLWIAIEPISGRLFIYREYVPEGEIGPTGFAQNIVKQVPGERYSYTVANPEIFAGDHTREPRTCDLFEFENLPCDPAPVDDEARANRVLAYQEPVWMLLPDLEAIESARLLIFPRCVNLRRVLSSATRGSTDPLARAVGYACASRPVEEGRRVNVAEEQMRWAERGTEERERRQEERQRAKRRH